MIVREIVDLCAEQLADYLSEVSRKGGEVLNILSDPFVTCLAHEAYRLSLEVQIPYHEGPLEMPGLGPDVFYLIRRFFKGYADGDEVIALLASYGWDVPLKDQMGIHVGAMSRHAAAENLAHAVLDADATRRDQS